MNDHEVEDLLRCSEGPEPRLRTSRAVIDAARGQLRQPKPAARASRLVRHLAPLAAACLCLAVIIRLLTAPATLGSVASDTLPVRRGSAILSLGRGGRLFAEDELLPTRRADICLADGSTVRLDARTRLLLDRPQEGERGRLALKTGRIFLRVDSAPGDFVVAGSAEVRVVGTAFGIAEKDGQTSVNVIAGRVAVRSGGKQIELCRGESAAAREGAPPAKTAADADAAVRWARDATRFENRTLGEALDWISRNSSYRFDAPPPLAETRVSLAVAHEPMREVIEALALACELKCSFQDHDVTMRE
jgi:hypothetical protein